MSTAVQPQPLALETVPDVRPALAETPAVAAAAQARAIIEAQYLMALRMPREPAKVRAGLLAACSRLTFAKSALYNKPVGGAQFVTGPSIRFAEEAARQLGNIRVEYAVRYEDDERRIVAVTVTDLEHNVSWPADVAVSKTVERRQLRSGQVALRTRTTSVGNVVHIVAATDDDLLTKQNAQCSKAARNGIMRLVPSDVVEEAMEQIERTLNDEDLGAARERMVKAFATLDVDGEQLTAYLGHAPAETTRKEIKRLGGIHQAIKDGETSWAAVMEALGRATPVSQQKGAAGLKAKLTEEEDARQQDGDVARKEGLGL